MDSSDPDYLLPLNGETSPGLYDAAASVEDDKATENDTDFDNRLDDSSPTRSYSSRFTSHCSHWSQPWSRNTEVCENHQKSQWSQPSDSGASGGPAQNSVEVATEVSDLNWLPQNDTCLIIGAGLENLGNTCFLNSILQCFIHTVPLLNGIFPNGDLMHSNCNKEGFCLLCAFRDLIVRSLTYNVVLPCSLADNLSYISSNFKRFQQEDAHEFLQCFLDRLERCHDSESQGGMSSKCDNIVKQVFGGCLVSNLKCCNCGHCSDTYEPSIDLSLEIEDADNLFAALHSFTKVERVEDPETKFTCEKCKEQVSVEKKLSFDQAPSVAVFHLKRFKNNGCFVQKIDKHVAFPLELDLLPFTGSGEKNDVELKYVLYAIVVHIGLTSTSGHYYCFIRLSPKIWCKFDDSRVVLVDENFVLSQEAYVLFYAREGIPWFSSFIERQKNFGHSTIWNTSPKSVLDNIDTSVSPSLPIKFDSNSSKATHDFGSEHSGTDKDEIKHSGPLQKKIESKGSIYDLRGMSDSAILYPSDCSDVSLPNAQKVSPVLLEEVNQDQEVCKLASSQNDTQTALRSPSPEIYREDPPDAGFSIPRDHLRVVDRMSCKRRLEKDMDDLEMKQACSFIKKTMHSSRGQQLLSAIRGPKNEASADRKKIRRSELSKDGSASGHHDSNIRPLRRFVAGANR